MYGMQVYLHISERDVSGMTTNKMMVFNKYTYVPLT